MNIIAADHKVVFSTLGECIVKYKPEFVDMLKECGISASIKDDPKDLADKYIRNVDSNPELLVASAYMCAYYSSDISFDGEKGVDNDQVHSISHGICQYFHCDGSHANFGGVVGAALSKGKEVLQGAYDKSQKTRSAGTDLLAQKESAKQQMVNAILEQQRMKQEAETKAAEEKRRKTKTYIIVGSVIGAVVLGTAIYLIIKSKKKK